MSTPPENDNVFTSLTPLGRARYLAREKQVYERCYPETIHGANLNIPQSRNTDGLEEPPPSFVALAAASTPWSRRTIQRAARIGARIDISLMDALADTPIARRTRDLEQISDMDTDEQQELLSRLRGAEQPPSTLSALMPNPHAPLPTPSNLDRLKLIWRRSSRAERDEFREWLADPDAGS
ncbi:MAG: hypothetical protein OXE57_16295 [Alphaproteobacteria bacterium]|nr:hypothetical protein [Alphaproteobacteria bacterium]